MCSLMWSIESVCAHHQHTCSSREVMHSGEAQAFKNPNADVRKAVVFCLVDMYLVLGEQLTPHLTSLSTSQACARKQL